MQNDKSKLDSAEKAIMDGLQKCDANIQKIQQEIIAWRGSGLTYAEISEKLIRTPFDGVDVEKFLAADTMEKRLDFMVEFLNEPD